MTTMTPINQCALDDLRWFLDQAKPRRMRTMRQFAEQEIILPSGPFAGTRFRCNRQPYTGLWFDQIDSGLWSRFVATGPTQSGKSLSCFIIPLVYHLFEYGETVICGLTDMDMAADKWREDILPIIERSRYKNLLPKMGAGSRGGLVQSLQFRNGATLKFMSGGGGDKSRAAFTSRVVVITETDGMDESGRLSRETDKISQLIARTRAFGSRARIYMECTVSTEQGRTWQEYTQGSQSRIVVPCPHCAAYVSPERDQLIGWQEALSQIEARNTAHFACPACGEVWNESQRCEANRASRLIHHGQSFDEAGKVVGNAPASDTLGFRWSAVNNLFVTAADLGGEEWKASRAVDEENAERERRQFVWCLPVVPTKWTDAEIQVHELASRVGPYPRGIAPPDTQWITAAIDLGKYLDHWIAVAWTDGPYAHVIDYGRIEVATDDLGVEQASIVALRQFRNIILQGWPMGVAGGEVKVSHLVFADAGYMTEVVYAFCRESGNRFIPAVGRGAAQQHQRFYSQVTQTGSTVAHLGEGFHINWLPRENVHLTEVDADHWKTWVHQRLCTPVGSPGSMTFFQATPTEHFALAKHLTAEVKTEEFIAGKGIVTKWERRRKQNHWFDTLYNACAAGNYCGVTLVQEEKKTPTPKPKQQEPKRQPWIDIERWRENQARIFGHMRDRP